MIVRYGLFGTSFLNKFFGLSDAFFLFIQSDCDGFAIIIDKLNPATYCVEVVP